MPRASCSARFSAFLLATVLALGAGVRASEAQDRATIVRILRESRDFRARVRAAMALGASADPAMAAPLAGALRDPEPAVRVAAANGLGRLGNLESLPALRGALSDPSREVRDAADRAIRAISAAAGTGSGGSSAGGAGARAGGSTRYEALRMPPVEVLPPERDVDWRNVRWAVVLGAMQNRSGFGAERMGEILTREVYRHLAVLRGVATLSDATPHPEADREVERRRIPRIRLEGSIHRIDRETRGRELRVRCEVALMLLDEPGRNLRAALRGAATGAEPLSGERSSQEQRLAEQALQGAVRSAMSGAARALASVLR
jgi:hypothetical protein